MQQWLNRTGLAVATAALAGGGAVALASPASASPNCPDTDAYHFFGGGPQGAGQTEWTEVHYH